MSHSAFELPADGSALLHATAAPPTHAVRAPATPTPSGIAAVLHAARGLHREKLASPLVADIASLPLQGEPVIKEARGEPIESIERAIDAGAGEMDTIVARGKTPPIEVRTAGDTVHGVFRITAQIATTSVSAPWKSAGVQAVTGSGVVIANRLGLTAAHVVTGALAIKITVPADPREYDAYVVAFSPADDADDWAVLYIPDFEGGVPIRIGSSDALTLGDEVIGLGYPVGQRTVAWQPGTVSSRQNGMVQTTIPTSGGMSGGPVVHDGRLVGLTVSKSANPQAEGIAFLTPIEKLLIRLKEIGPTRFLARAPDLGLDVQPGGAELSEVVGSGCAQGVYVRAAVAGGPAHAAGIRTGDVVCAIEGAAVTFQGTMRVSWSDERVALAEVLARFPAGAPIAIRYWSAAAGAMRTAAVPNVHNTARGVRRVETAVEPIKYAFFAGLVLAEVSTNHFGDRSAPGPVFPQMHTLVANSPPERRMVGVSAAFENWRTIAPGDVLARINGRAIETIEDVYDALLEPTIGKDDVVFAFETTDGYLTVINGEDAFKADQRAARFTGAPFMTPQHAALLQKIRTLDPTGDKIDKIDKIDHRQPPPTMPPMDALLAIQLTAGQDKATESNPFAGESG